MTVMQKEERLEQLFYCFPKKPAIFESLLCRQVLLVIYPILQIICLYVLYTLVFPFLLQVLTAQDLVDFSPVYRCLHIYSVLVCVKVTLKRKLNF